MCLSLSHFFLCALANAFSFSDIYSSNVWHHFERSYEKIAWWYALQTLHPRHLKRHVSNMSIPSWWKTFLMKVKVELRVGVNVKKVSAPLFYSRKRHSWWSCCLLHFGMLRLGYVFVHARARSTGCDFIHAMFAMGVRAFCIKNLWMKKVY